MRGINADDFIAGLFVGIFLLAELTGNANRLRLAGNVNTTLCLNITGEITFIGSAAHVFNPCVKTAGQILVADPPAFSPGAD